MAILPVMVDTPATPALFLKLTPPILLLPNPRYPINFEKIEALRQLKETQGKAFPRVGIFLVSYNASSLLVETLQRIPRPFLELVEEVFVFDDFSTDDTFELAAALSENPEWGKKLKAYRNCKNFGYGGNQKIGFQYACEKGLDFVVLLHGDGQYAPECLPDLVYEAILGNKDVVFGSRMQPRWSALRGGMPFYKWVGNGLLTLFQNLCLGLWLSEFHSGYRLYATSVLKRVPYQQNADDFSFDSEIIIQCRAAGYPPYEIPIPTFYGAEISRVPGLRYAFQVCCATVRYRLHQLRFVYDAKYDVDTRVLYQFKSSRFSSHGKILKRVEAGSSVLDLGCGPGLLASRLVEKGATVLGVDVAEPENSSFEFQYNDLEQFPLWKSARKFDYVLMADVIEHVRRPEALLAATRSYLKTDGRLIASTGNICVWYYRLSLLLGRFNYGPRGILDKGHQHLYTVDTFKKLLLEAGYHIVKLSYTNLPFELVFRSTGNSRLIKALDRAYSWLVACWPALFAYQTIIEAEVRGTYEECGR